VEAGYFFSCEGSGLPGRVDTSPKEAFINVNVPQAGQQFLI